MATIAAAAATANIIAFTLNADNSFAAPKGDTSTAYWITALILPTPPNTTDRTRSESTEREKVEHKGEAELQQATTKIPPRSTINPMQTHHEIIKKKCNSLRGNPMGRGKNKLLQRKN
jgi:hypothetical protein